MNVVNKSIERTEILLLRIDVMALFLKLTHRNLNFPYSLLLNLLL